MLASLIHTHTLLGEIAFWVVFLIIYCALAWYIFIPLFVWYSRSWLRVFILISALFLFYVVILILTIIEGSSITFSLVGGLVMYLVFTVAIWFSRDRWKGLPDLRPGIKKWIRNRYEKRAS